MSPHRRLLRSQAPSRAMLYRALRHAVAMLLLGVVGSVIAHAQDTSSPVAAPPPPASAAPVDTPAATTTAPAVTTTAPAVTTTPAADAVPAANSVNGDAPTQSSSSTPAVAPTPAATPADAPLPAPSTEEPRHHGLSRLPNFDVGLTYTQERSKFAGAYCECFPLRGATIDVAVDVFHGLGVIGSAQGVAASNLNGSIDIHQITFLGGVRYTYNLGHNEALMWARKGSAFITGMGGYTFATSGLYPNSNDTALTDHASALTYMGGGGINIHVYERLDVRLIEVDYVRTNLPNGGNNQQNTLRAAAGLNIHFGH